MAAAFVAGLCLSAAPQPLSAGPAKPQRCVLSGALPTGSARLDYGPRGNRCEGIFARQVSTAIQMRVIGFQRGRGASAPFRPNQVVGVRTPAGAAGEVILRATATPPTINYGMDTRQVAANGLFEWDTSILADPRLALSGDQLALMACSNECRPTPDTVYWPVEMTQPASDATGRYVVTVVARRDLKKLTYSLISGGKTLSRQDRDGPLFAGSPVRLNLGELPPGEFQLTIDAVTAESQRERLELRLRTTARL